MYNPHPESTESFASKYKMLCHNLHCRSKRIAQNGFTQSSIDFHNDSSPLVTFSELLNWKFLAIILIILRFLSE